MYTVRTKLFWGNDNLEDAVQWTRWTRWGRFETGSLVV